MLKYVTLFIILAVSLSGCSIHPKSAVQTKDSLVISLSGSANNNYFLIDERGRIVSQDSAKDGELTFSIPANVDTKSCLLVQDQKGKKLTESSYQITFIDQYRSLDNYKQFLESAVARKVQEHADLNRNFQDVKIRMEGHNAYSNRRCHLPDQREIPERPITRCGSYNECLEEGGAICFSRFIGSEGCSMALKEINISGMLASPACSATAARLAGDKYDMDDVFVDFLHGVADDAGGKLIKSESWFDKTLGVLVIATNYGLKLENARNCTNNFVQTYYGPMLVWQQQVREIQLEPERIKANCESLIVQHNDYLEQRDRTFDDWQSFSNTLTDVSIVHDELSMLTYAAPLCDSTKNLKSVSNPMLFKRYLIGLHIENIEDKNTGSITGVRVSSLIEKLPAIKAGVREGDQILSINNVPITDILNFMREIQKSEGRAIALSVSREGKLKKFNIVPTFKKVEIPKLASYTY